MVAATSVFEEKKRTRRSRLTDFLNRLVREKPLGSACGVVILALVFVSILAPVLAPYPIDELHVPDRLQGSSFKYLLGTDHVGRDLFSRMLFGARISLFIGFSATAIGVTIAMFVGGTSGFIGGKLDLIVQRFVDAWIAFPGLLFLLTIISIIGLGYIQMIAVLGIGGIGGSRVSRGVVISIKENDYFLAARAIGNRTDRILIRHVLPNVLPIMIIGFSIGIGGAILAVSALSFLGFGLPPGTPDWGSMLSREGRQYMEIAPHLALWPGFALTIVIYCLNMFGDAMRDLLDPRLRGAGS